MPTPAYILRLRQKIGHDLIMMPVAGALMTDDEGRILLQQRSDGIALVLGDGRKVDIRQGRHAPNIP